MHVRRARLGTRRSVARRRVHLFVVIVQRVLEGLVLEVQAVAALVLQALTNHLLAMQRVWIVISDSQHQVVQRREPWR